MKAKLAPSTVRTTNVFAEAQQTCAAPLDTPRAPGEPTHRSRGGRYYVMVCDSRGGMLYKWGGRHPTATHAFECALRGSKKHGWYAYEVRCQGQAAPVIDSLLPGIEVHGKHVFGDVNVHLKAFAQSCVKE